MLTAREIAIVSYPIRITAPKQEKTRNEYLVQVLTDKIEEYGKSCFSAGRTIEVTVDDDKIEIEKKLLYKDFDQFLESIKATE